MGKHVNVLESVDVSVLEHVDDRTFSALESVDEGTC